MNKVSAAAVSRYLAQKFERSESHSTRVRGWHTTTRGFRVSGQRYRHAVHVDYMVGTWRSGPVSGKAVALEMLAKYQEHLSQRYDVTLDDGKSWGPYLIVTSKTTES